MIQKIETVHAVDDPAGVQLEAMQYKVAGWSSQPPDTPDDQWECEQVWFILTVPVAGTAAQIRFRLKSKRAYDEFMKAFQDAGSVRWKGDAPPAPPG